MDRDSKGRLAPGHRDLYTPEQRAEDRRRKAKQRYDLARRYREAIAQTLGPEEIPQLLTEMLEFVRHYKSSRGMEALLRFVVEYGIGKPQRENDLQAGEASPEDWANAFADTVQGGVKEWPEDKLPGLVGDLQRKQGEQALREDQNRRPLDL